jgi:TonB-dependent starch-binding outer membrane protein SusC
MILANMRKGVLLLLTFLGFAFSTQAQTTVTGKVTDKKGDPVPGVTITVKGAKNATSTNNQGVYTLNNVASDAVLRFTGAGFTTQEIGLNGKTSVDAEMDNSVGNLNEVVVVGYGTKKVKDATGSVAALSTKDFNKGQISTPEQMLQGRTPGVASLEQLQRLLSGVALQLEVTRNPCMWWMGFL